MRSRLRLAVLALTFALTPALAADDRLGVPGPIAITGTSYELASGDTAQPGYVKQEYIPAGQTLDRFETMVLVEFLEGATKPEDVVRPQIRMLEERRATDPLVNYEVFLANEGGGIILDFLLSGESEDGTRIAEWNAYRYVAGQNPQGKAGGWLVGISRRAYGDDITPFLGRLRDRRSADVAGLVALGVPPRTAD